MPPQNMLFEQKGYFELKAIEKTQFREVLCLPSSYLKAEYKLIKVSTPPLSTRKDRN
jgi:hypothetical protein